MSDFPNIWGLTFVILFCVLSLGYTNNIFKDTDKVVLVHAVEMHEILNSQQWYASKYKLSYNNSVSDCNINKK